MTLCDGGGPFVGAFIDLQKLSAALLLFIICFSASLAAANELGSYSTPTTRPADKAPQNLSGEINSDCFTGYSVKFTSARSAFEYKDMPVSPPGECLEDSAAITLHRDGDKSMWSLVPWLSSYSLNPIDDIRNLQVLLRYRF